MNVFETYKPWLGRKSVRGAIVLALIIAISLFFVLKGGKEAEVSTEKLNPLVTLTTSSEYLGGESLSLIGNVRAFTEAAITTERAGRVVSVNVSLGQTVQAGQIIATLENASERASVLQAEGVYDAAVAASAQSGIGVEEAKVAEQNAKNTAVSTFKSTYNTVNGSILNNIDTFFASPKTGIPGLKLDGKGYTDALNAERVSFQTLLPAWESRVNTISTNSDLEAELAYVKQNVQKTISFVDTFLTVIALQSNSSRYTDAELKNFRTSFTNLRSSLLATQSSIDSALTGLSSAQETINRAELAASGGTSSAADAQIKQALGALRSAQANLAKTILRTPISGTVNSISLRTGDFVNSFDQIAEVANNNALEVVTYVSDNEIELLSVGDTVLIENEFEGTITQIAPAVDSATRKTEVRIATENTEIKNGDTVTISKEIQESQSSAVIIPLTAVKFEIQDGFIFTVEDNKLVQKPVVLGTVRGSSVEILEGLSATDAFVLDSRGLLPGNEVTVSE